MLTSISYARERKNQRKRNYVYIHIMYIILTTKKDTFTTN